MKKEISKNTNKSIVAIIFNVILLLLVSCNNKAKRVKETFPDGSPRVVFEYENKADTSNYIIKVYYQQGSLHQKIPVKNGKFAGITNIYYPDGKVAEIDSLYGTRNMNSHDWDGIATHFYNNGKISERFIIKNAERNGLSWHYDTNGILVKKYELKHDSIKDGIYREFYRNGSIFIQDTFQNDTLIGFEYVFKENGDTLKYNAFYEGHESFPIKKWLDNGNILEGKYLDKQEKAVIWTWHNKNGKQIKTRISYPKKGQYISPE